MLCISDLSNTQGKTFAILFLLLFGKIMYASRPRGNIVFLFRVISCIVLYAIGTIRPFLTAPYEYHNTWRRPVYQSLILTGTCFLTCNPYSGCLRYYLSTLLIIECLLSGWIKRKRIETVLNSRKFSVFLCHYQLLFPDSFWSRLWAPHDTWSKDPVKTEDDGPSADDFSSSVFCLIFAVYFSSSAKC